MMRGVLAGIAALAAAVSAGPAAAAQYLFSYGFNGSLLASGMITTSGAGPAFAPGSMQVTNVSNGSRVGAGSISGFQNSFDVDQGDQLIFPSRPAGYVDDQGLTYQVGLYSYNIVSPSANSGGGPNGTYIEYRYLTSDPFGPQQSQFVSSFTLTPVTAGAVPEPATWAMLIGGMALAGGALRRRRPWRAAARAA